jgi:hypothetical protein
MPAVYAAARSLTSGLSSYAARCRGRASDVPIVDLLISKAMSDVRTRQATQWAEPADERALQQLASIYNTVEFLSYFRGPADQQQKARSAAFLTAATPNSSDTGRLATTIRDRFQ